jgi:NADPH-dependent ferric siderophore reductase
VLLVEGVEEERELHSDAKLDVRWVHRAADSTAALVRALDGAVGPRFDGFVWLAGEASEVRRVYRHVVQDQQVEVRRVHASGHWKRGVVNHDHHEPIEAAEPA